MKTSEIKLFFLHYRDGYNKEHIMIISEKNAESARVAASCIEAKYDDNKIQKRNFRWLANDTVCKEISNIKDQLLIFHKNPNEATTYFKGKLI